MLSIVLPAYNEEKNIGEALRDITTYLDSLGLQFEIVVTNDGSGDHTGDILAEWQKKEPRLKVVTHKKNLGYGAAVRSGFGAASGDLIFFTDSDRQFDIREIGQFLEKIKDYDFVIGYRQRRQDPPLRKLYAAIFRKIAAIFFGVKVRDVDCAFKLFRAEVLKNMPLTSSGALINLEILAIAKKRGYKFLELPVSHFPRRAGKQTGGSFKVIFRAAVRLASLWWRTRYMQ